MFARMSRAPVKPEKRGEILETIKKLETETHQLPGVRFWLTLMGADGVLTVVGGYDDKAACDRTAHVNQARWDGARDMLAEGPTIVEGEVLAFVAPR